MGWQQDIQLYMQEMSGYMYITVNHTKPEGQ